MDCISNIQCEIIKDDFIGKIMKINLFMMGVFANCPDNIRVSGNGPINFNILISSYGGFLAQ
jgi:hypothetical protein